MRRDDDVMGRAGWQARGCKMQISTTKLIWPPTEGSEFMTATTTTPMMMMMMIME